MKRKISYNNSVEAIYIFSDIRDFSIEIKKSSDEMKKFLEVYYELAIKIFGKIGSNPRNDKTYKKISKFLGDGFFSVNEYIDLADFKFKLLESLNDIDKFINKIKEEKKNIVASEISPQFKLGFGMTYGSSVKIIVDKYHTEYIGNIINISSRLCEKAKPSGIIIRKTDEIFDIIQGSVFKDTYICDKCSIKNEGNVDILKTRDVKV